MFQPEPGFADRPRRLALLNHRGEALDALRSGFQERGWTVLSSERLDRSARLLAEEDPDAAVVAPLTLDPGTLEWELLTAGLSPTRPVPWLVLPWPAAPIHALGGLFRPSGTLADWLSLPVSPAEAAARLGNLLRLQGLVAAERARSAELEGQLITDHKTGLANDRHFRDRLEQEFERTRRHGSPLGLILLDLDDFKRLNDEASYEFGDLALRAVGRILRRSVRAIDIPARIGGDEFAVLLPNTTLEEAVGVAERILAAAGRSRVEEGPHAADLRLSLGVAGFTGHGLEQPRELFLRANEALEEAKRSGKGKVRFSDPRRRRSRSRGAET
ncbi:MAG: GGDEF domain-containing protein [Planctomycetota bacterium]|nr:MAG: GGDEF domain-containing protein [Planctomycetota bacterium]